MDEGESSLVVVTYKVREQILAGEGFPLLFTTERELPNQHLEEKARLSIAGLPTLTKVSHNHRIHNHRSEK